MGLDVLSLAEINNSLDVTNEFINYELNLISTVISSFSKKIIFFDNVKTLT